jgi:31-O-methyltransferase
MRRAAAPSAPPQPSLPQRSRCRRPRCCARARAAAAAAAAAAWLPAALRRRRTRTLPNGLQLEYVSAPDVAFLYDEVFVQRCYAAHGLPPLRPGDTVLDVGANIGVFALYAAAAVAPGGVLLSAEPAPATCDVLRRNLARHVSAADVDVRVRCVALSDGAAQAAELVFYPRAAGWSSLYANDAEVAANVAAFADAALAPALAALAAPLRALAPLLARLRGPGRAAGAGPPAEATPRRLRWLRSALAALGAWLYAAALRAVLRRMLGGAVRTQCALTSVSALLASEGIAADAPIALLKIDVERAELDVLRGVAPADWPRIRAVAAEVHDAGGRLAEVQQLLREPPAAFARVTAVQPAALRGSNLWNVYAVRDAAADAADAAAADPAA